MDLLSDELWPVPQFVSTGGGNSGRRKRARRGEPAETAGKPADEAGDDEATGLPASVINQYRDGLDQEGQDFLRRGPRSFEEQLAYAQQVRPSAFQNATPASMDDQLRFWRGRDVDWAGNFVGPNGVVYIRDDWMNVEKPEARIFRAYENMVGGFKRPKLDDLLNQLNLRDRLEGYSPETKAKIADVESFDRPPSADQAAWEDWARDQGVNPATWFMAERMPEEWQTGYWSGESRDVAPVLNKGSFIGPDGFMYRRNDQTRDLVAEKAAGIEHERIVDALRDAPPPSLEEVYDRFLSSGGLLPQPIMGRGYRPWKRRTRQDINYLLGRSDGGRGDAGTRDDLEQQLHISLLRNPSLKHIRGSRNKLGIEVPEEEVPNPAGTLLRNGREKSIRPDVTLVAQDALRRYILRLQHATMTRFGKPDRDSEDAKALRLFLRTHSNGYKDVPWSYVYVLTKRNQLQKLLDKYRKRLDAKDDAPKGLLKILDTYHRWLGKKESPREGDDDE
jgi:hypothetical protein